MKLLRVAGFLAPLALASPCGAATCDFLQARIAEHAALGEQAVSVQMRIVVLLLERGDLDAALKGVLLEIADSLNAQSKEHARILRELGNYARYNKC